MANTHPPATAKGRATRKRILQAAAALVAEKGAAGMSLDDVRARTGASRSQLYHYFEDRDDLVRAVIDVTTDTLLGNQGDLLDRLDSWAGIDRWFDLMVQDQINKHARGGCPIGSLVGQLAEHDPEACAALASGFDRGDTPIRDGPRQASQRRRSRGARHRHHGKHPRRPPPHPGPPGPAPAPYGPGRSAQQPPHRRRLIHRRDAHPAWRPLWSQRLGT
jgi:TetR/AcrR family transcriptional repressor of nem operon